MKESRQPSSIDLVRAEIRPEVPGMIRNSFLAGLVVFLLCGGSTLLVYLNAESNEWGKKRLLLREEASFAASLVDQKTHRSLLSADQMNSQEYQKLAAQLQKVRENFSGISELYTARYVDGTVQEVIATNEPGSVPFNRPRIGRAIGGKLSPASEEGRAIVEGRLTLVERPSLGSSAEESLGVIAPLGTGLDGAPEFLFLGSRFGLLNTNLTALQTALAMSLSGALVLGLLVGTGSYTLRYRSRFNQELAVMRLRESEELFRSTYALSPVAMCLTDTSGRVLRANRGFCDFLGYSEYELVRMNVEQFTHPDDLAEEQPLLRALRHHQNTQYRIEKRYRRRNGEFAWGLTGVAVVRDSDGVSSHFMIQAVDITERKRAEETLRLSQERLALAADAGRVGVWDCDLLTGRMVWNDVMHEIYHTDPKEFAPTLELQRDCVHPDDRDAVVKMFSEGIASEDSYRSEHRIVVDRKKIRHLRSCAVVFRDENKRPVRALGTTIDITAEKEESRELIRAKEVALAADRAKSEFLAVMSHEIRTPLNGVLGFVSLLKQTSLTDEQHSFIETMESSGERLLSLVNDILDLSKIESGEASFEPEVIEVGPYLTGIHRQLEARAWEKKLRYELTLDPDLPKYLYTDPARLGQVLTNLLGNAVKFTDSGKVELKVMTRPVPDRKNRLEWTFCVSDTGPGIPTEAAGNLSKLFYQVDSSTTRRYGGTGMGLAISCRLAGLMSGQIRVRSKLDEGSEFTLEIQVKEPPKEVKIGSSEKPATAVEALTGVKGKRILVVEDNAINRKLCALQLRRMECETEFAVTGREGVEKVRAGKFDAVLMDMQLPDLDGCDATREIRKAETTGSHVPIIALTANAMPEDRRKCFASGMDDFLSKPLKFEILAETLAKWV